LGQDSPTMMMKRGKNVKNFESKTCIQSIFNLHSILLQI
jgi:hypothetical protein